MTIRFLFVVTLVLTGCTEDTRPTGDASADTSTTLDSSPTDSSGGGSCGGETCGAGSVCCGPPECGMCVPEGSGVFCGFSCDAGTAADTGTADAAAPTACNPGTADTCGAGLGCECCGDIGPSPICVCTTTCTSNADCTDAERPFCNLDPTGSSGVCVTPTFECCWGCD